MVSKAIAALDAWLIRAEEVLQEQRKQCISPNLGWRQTFDEWTVTLADFELGLPDLLGSLCSRPGRWIVIAEVEEQRNHFWQALAFEDGSLVTEVVSNRFLEGDDRLTPWDELRLVQLGWDAPEQPKRPNWLVVEPTTSPDVDNVACRTVATLRTVFRLSDEDRLLVKMFSSANRGSTPAVAEYAENDVEDRVDPLSEIAPTREQSAEADVSEELALHNPTGRTGETGASQSQRGVYSRPPVNGTRAEIEEWARGFVTCLLGSDELIQS